MKGLMLIALSFCLNLTFAAEMALKAGSTLKLRSDVSAQEKERLHLASEITAEEAERMLADTTIYSKSSLNPKKAFLFANDTPDEIKYVIIGMLIFVWIVAIILASYCICCRSEGTESAEFKEYEEKMSKKDPKEDEEEKMLMGDEENKMEDPPAEMME